MESYLSNNPRPPLSQLQNAPSAFVPPTGAYLYRRHVSTKQQQYVCPILLLSDSVYMTLNLARENELYTRTYAVL